MNIAVLLSIRPKYCELIANGEKTVEVRKTRPKIDPPFIVPIYCTKKVIKTETFAGNICEMMYKGCGKVIGEFVCDEIQGFNYGIQEPSDSTNWQDCYFGYTEDLYEMEGTQLSEAEINKYGAGKFIYTWHISDLKIYDRPKELGEFCHPCEIDSCDKCKYCEPFYGAYGDIYNSCCSRMDRPPQSWCYVAM